MQSQARIFVLLTATGCAALVALQLLGLPVAAATAKIVASCSFIGVALSSGALRSAYGGIVLAGLALSWFGDVFLIGQSQALFLAGLLAFLLAHVAYIAAFAVHGVSLRWVLLAALPIAIAAFGVSAWLTPHIAPWLLLPVRVYTIVISMMVVMAIGTRGVGGSWLIVAGALLFYASDLSVASLRLVQTELPMYAWGLPFYYAGQVCLALSTRSQSSSQ